MTTSSSSSSDSDSINDEFFDEILQDSGQEIQGYMFQPTRVVSDSSDSDSVSSSESLTVNPRLQSSDW